MRWTPSISHLPQTKVEFTDNMDGDSDGLGLQGGLDAGAT